MRTIFTFGVLLITVSVLNQVISFPHRHGRHHVVHDKSTIEEFYPHRPVYENLHLDDFTLAVVAIQNTLFQTKTCWENTFDAMDKELQSKMDGEQIKSKLRDVQRSSFDDLLLLTLHADMKLNPKMSRQQVAHFIVNMWTKLQGIVKDSMHKMQNILKNDGDLSIFQLPNLKKVAMENEAVMEKAVKPLQEFVRKFPPKSKKHCNENKCDNLVTKQVILA